MPRLGCATIPNAESLTEQSSRFPSRAARALAVAALCLGLLASPAAAQWAAPDLFPSPPVPTNAGPHGLEALEGVIDATPALRGLGRLRMKLPGGGMVQMARDGFERRRDGNVTWRGRIAGEEDSRVILTVGNGYVAGWIQRGLDEYEIRPGPGRSHVIERVDTSVQSVEEELVEPPVDYSSYDWDPIYAPDPYPLVYGNSPDNIQLLAVYTAEARAAAGGKPQIEVRIQSMVDLVNAAFVDSGMIARIALVRTEEVAHSEQFPLELNLGWASGDSGDGDYTVPLKRSFWGADLVSMIVHNGGRCASAAYVMHIPDRAFAPWAYSVSALSCGAGTLAHEIGHNMGFEHNPEDSVRGADGATDMYGNPIDPSYPWSFGHYVDGSFRTIMSYPTPCLSGCPMVPHFSNPDISFLGAPTGIVDARDNARTGDLTAPIVADFMDVVTGAVVNRRIAASVEDVEETADGTVILDSTTLELGNGGLGGVEAVGLRFQNIHIPPGMRIDSAYLEFEAADLGSDVTTVEIRAEAADNAASFSSTPFDVTGRPATLAAVPWDIPAWDTVTEKHYSPDISAVIQEVVNRPGWLENNSMVLTVDGTGIRTALSHDGGAISAPLLHVEYSDPTGPTTLEMPVATFGYSCTGLTCTFTDQSTSSNGAIVDWQWTFNSDPWTVFHTSVEQNPTVTFPAEGTYAISLRVIDSFGVAGSTEQSLIITATGANMVPVATDNFYETEFVYTASGIISSPLTGNVLTDGTPDSDLDGDPLTVTATDGPFYGGTVSVAPNGDFTYTPGNYGIDWFDYTISDGKGGTATATVIIDVRSKFMAEFSYSCIELTCSFADTSTSPDGPIVDWYWIFIDPGDPSDPYNWTETILAEMPEQSPTYTFPGPGTYRVELVVADSTGQFSAPVSKDITISIANYPPTASFNHSCTGSSCTFTDSSTDVEGPIAAWSWDFGDGTTSTLQNPVYSYAADGSYTVTLTVTDAEGKTGTTSQILIANTTPVSAFNASCADRNCSFTDGSVDPGGIASWSWTFGDGATSTAQSPTRVYAADGIYTVTLTVTDTLGATDTASQTITVANTPPVAGFTVSCVDTACDFTDGSTDGDRITRWRWAFGDGETSISQNPRYGYSADGTYTVTLTVTDTAGATSTASQTVTVVNTPPTAGFTVNCTGLQCDFTDNSTDASRIVRWIWSMGDGLVMDRTILGPSFTRSYAAAGTYTVTLQVSDALGETDTTSRTVTVTDTVPVANFEVSCAGLNCNFTDGSVAPGGIASWAWSFGDGATSTAQNPAHSYAADGAYGVALTITDTTGATGTANRTVTVSGTGPVANNDSYVVYEDTVLKGNVITAGVPDSDGDGGVLTVTTHTDPLNGTVTVAADGRFTYTPNANFNGSDSFTYTIGDGSGRSATATVQISILAVNDPPVAAFNYSCVGLTCTFKDYSTDVDGTITNWWWTKDSPDVFAFGFFAEFTHTFEGSLPSRIYLKVTSSDGGTSTVWRDSPNSTPVATDNAYSTAENTPVSGNVLLDGTPDSDANGDALTVTTNTSPPSGTATIAANGAFTYTPNANFSGADSFTYTVSDGIATATATVTITVSPVNDAPVATDDDYSTNEDVAVSGNFLTDGTPDSDADGDALTVTANTDPTNGTVTVAADGAFTYTPNADFNGTDSFTYTVSDSLLTATATVTVTVDPVNDAPVAAFSDNCTDLDCVFTDGSTDIDGAIVSWNWSFHFDQSFPPDQSTLQNPSYSFPSVNEYLVSLTVTDSDGASAEVSKYVFLNIDDYPPDAGFAYNCSGLSCSFMDMSTDVEGAISGWSWDFGDGATSTIQFPEHDYTTAGSYAVTLTVTDAGGKTGTATQTLTVNSPPVATADAYTTSEDMALSGNVLTDGTPDSDADGDVLAVTANTAPISGTVTVAANGAFTYTPNADFNGADSFTYTVSDGTDTATATVTITVSPVNDAPVAAFSHGCAGLNCAFTDGSTDIEGAIASWSWSFGDGPTSTLQNPTHRYAADGTYTVSVTVTDGAAATATATQAVTVANTAPVATANAYTTAEDVAASGNVLTDGVPDSDADGDALTVTANTSTTSGTVSVAANGAFTYTPNADFNGSDSFSYTLSDGLLTATATVTITVTPVNDAPVASADAYTTAEDTAVSGNVLLDGTPDSDADGDVLAVTANTAPLNGAATVAANGAFTYTPNADFNGADSFTYTVSDGVATATATVSLTVNSVNDAPVANADAYTTGEDVAVSGNVLLDGTPDSDADGDALTVTANSNPTNGTVTVAANGAFTYTPNANFNGTDSFTYTVSDGTATANATVGITVTPVNDAPVAAFGHGCAGVNCTFADGSADIEGAIAAWSWSFGDGAVSAVQNPAYSYAAEGTYTVTLTVTDGEGTTATATQAVTVTNTPPVATDNAYTTDEDVAVSGNFMTDGVPDSDPDGDPITLLDISMTVALGTVTGGAGGNFTYTPPPNFSGTDSFRYSIIDGISGGATGTVTITVNPVNDIPFAAFTHDCLGRACTFADGSSDVDGQIVAWSWNFGDGAVSTARNPAHSYGTDGTYTVSLTVTDGQGATNTVSKAVIAVNTVPVATADTYVTNEDTAVSGNVLTDGTPDSDADGDALTVTANTSPLNGAVTVAANGAFTYTPAADFNGSDSFTYTIGDGNGGAATATVGVTVSPVNDAPVASFGSACTDLDCAFTDGSADIDGTIASWSWDFGDGAVSTLQSPTHSYVAVDATYTVTLTVTDDQGASDTAAQSVTVTNPFPPTAPANLTGAVTSSGNGSKAILSVSLSWTDTAINEESFVIERCEIQGGGNNATCVFAPVAEVGADTTAFAEDLAMGSYRYRVKARNRNGDSGYSNVFEVLKQQV